MGLKLGHRGLQAPGRLELRQKQSRFPFQAPGGPQSCSPSCNSRSACAAPQPGSLGGLPTCGGSGRSRPLTISPEPSFSWRADTHRAQKISVWRGGTWVAQSSIQLLVSSSCHDLTVGEIKPHGSALRFSLSLSLSLCPSPAWLCLSRNK